MLSFSFRRNILLLSVCLALLTSVSRAKLFAFNNPQTSEPCLLADVDFVVDLAAVRQGETIAETRVSSNDEGVDVSGSCGDYKSVLTIVFPNGINWALVFRQDDNQMVTMNRYVQFIPVKIFGEKVPIKEYQTMDDPLATDLGNATESYECPVPETVEYEEETVTTETNFTVEAKVSYLQVQAFDVFGSNFSTSHLCASAISTTMSPTSNVSSTMAPTHETENTTASHNMTTVYHNMTTQHHNMTTAPTEPPTSQKPTAKPTTTSSPTPPLILYTVEDVDNNICIAMEIALTIDINYPVEGKEKTKTANIFVPKDSKGSGNCSLTASSQDLVISFLDGWKLRFTFTSKKANLLESVILNSEEKGTHPKYTISKVELSGSADKQLFPGTTWPAGKELSFKSEKLNFPEMSPSKAYYKCSSSLTTKLGPDADVKSQDLRVKAFNQNNKTDFNGQAAVCAADSGSSRKTTYIIVGCVLAGIVVLSFIVFVVMRVIKKRRENYQSLQ